MVRVIIFIKKELEMKRSDYLTSLQLRMGITMSESRTGKVDTHWADYLET